MADIAKLVDQLSELTVLEAAELAKALEEKWGVSAAAAVAVAGPAAAAAAPAAEEKTEFDVILTGDGGKKINVIKEVRAITGLGLGEAKALVEGAPAAEEKTEFDVILTGDGGKKINVIKEVRAITGLGLGEAKALVEGAPKAVKEGVNKDEAEKIKKQIEDAGGTVELK